jgi:hypothetical protein
LSEPYQVSSRSQIGRVLSIKSDTDLRFFFALPSRHPIHQQYGFELEVSDLKMLEKCK